VEVTETWTDKGTASDFITIAGDRIFFGFDQSGLKQESKNILLQQCDWLKAHNHHKLLIEGHCDERGSREYNLGLGERRAESVARFLVEQGISGDRIRTISYGKDRPVVAQGSEEEIHRLNRVAISVVE
jgi:peptidoglycan-associated lipoprotein